MHCCGYYFCKYTTKYIMKRWWSSGLKKNGPSLGFCFELCQCHNKIVFISWLTVHEMHVLEFFTYSMNASQSSPLFSLSDVNQPVTYSSLSSPHQFFGLSLLIFYICFKIHNPSYSVVLFPSHNIREINNRIKYPPH